MIHLFFFLNDTATTEIYTLPLHDALPIFDGQIEEHLPKLLGVGAHLRQRLGQARADLDPGRPLFLLDELQRLSHDRSEEHTSELQSPCNLVCRLLLEKKKRQGRDAARVQL